LDLATYTLALAIYTLDITSHLKLHILPGSVAAAWLAASQLTETAAFAGSGL